MNLRIFDSTDELIAGTAAAILQRIENGARTIALSGGSTPKPLYRLLGENEALRSVPITWIVVDERWVPIHDPQSNAGMMRETLFANGIPDAQRFLQFRTELGDAAAGVREFEREWKALGVEAIDLVLLGIGDDGHTASLFPGTTALNVEDRIATELFVPRLDMWRVTLTKRPLRDAKMRFVLAAGASKRPVLDRVRAGSDDPISVVTKGRETWWFVDRSAMDSSD